MKKKEVLWISREPSGFYEIWREKPHKRKGWWIGKTYKGRITDIHVRSCLATRIKCGGLAKITIERQY